MSPLNSSMTTTGLWLEPTRRSSGLKETSLQPPRIQKYGGSRNSRRPFSLELVAKARLEGALIAGNLAVFDPRCRVTATGAPRRIVAVQPVEDVEDLEVCGQLMTTPWHLERLRDTNVEPLVADVLLREE